MTVAIQTPLAEWRQNADGSWGPVPTLGQREAASGKGGGWTRQDVTITTASLAPGQTENSTVDMAAGWRIYAVTFSGPARLRLYASTTQRLSDSSRPIGTDPVGSENHGLLFEFVSTAQLLSAVLSPQVDGYCPAGTLVPYALTNTGAVTAPIVATLTFVRTE